MEEVWRDVKGYEGLYQVSNMGRVKSLARVNSLGRRVNERILRPDRNNNGYLMVGLHRNGKRKQYTIHRLVLSTFNPNPDMENLEVNHLNENKENNQLDNLEWCTRSYNINYGTRNKRDAEKQSIPIVQLTLDGKYIRSWKSSKDAKREGGFNQAHINDCCKGRYKTHGGYKWCYLSSFIDKNNGIID